MFVPWIDVSDCIITFWLAHRSINLPSSVIGKFVHETVLHGWEDLIVDSVAVSSYVILFLDVWIDPTSNSDHPQELVDIITAVMTHTSVNNQNIVNIKFITNFKSFILGRWHGQTYCSNVCIVPGVIVNQSGPVRESCDLVTVIPPWHDDGFLFCVHSEPVVCLTIVVYDVSLATVFGGENDGWGGIRLGSGHCTVADECAQENGDENEKDDSDNARHSFGLFGFLLLLFAWFVEQFLDFAVYGFDTVFKDPAQTDGGRDACCRGKDQQKTNHDWGKIHT